jgi:hypothetical protein
VVHRDRRFQPPRCAHAEETPNEHMATPASSAGTLQRTAAARRQLPPVTYTADKFPAGMIRYESREQFTGLKAELAATHVVIIRTGDQVACVPISADASAVGKATELDVREHRRVVAHLVEAALVRSVLAPRYKLRRLVPPAFVQRGPRSHARGDAGSRNRAGRNKRASGVLPGLTCDRPGRTASKAYPGRVTAVS